MSYILVRGGRPLSGTVRVHGAKNAVLPIIAGTLLCQTPTKLVDVPALHDVATISDVIRHLGAEVNLGTNTAQVDAGCLTDFEAPYDLVRKMRASVLIMGPLLSRLGRARVALPGGCAIGSRPIDLHLKGFAALGAEIVLGHGFVQAEAAKLHGARIYLDFPSVGATENIMMAAVCAEGTTTIENAAEEPEISDLATFLNACGAHIHGAGTDVIRIEGVQGLHGCEHQVIPDRIEAGTYLVAGAITGGDIVVENAVGAHLKPVIAKLREVGCTIEDLGDALHLRANGRPRAIDVTTLPYPGFPTDMQAQMTSLLAVAEGNSVVTETVFENRFMHVDELRRMGARIRIDGRSAFVTGVDQLTGAPVNATDLRAGAALVLAGLAAEGETRVGCISHIDRGYVSLVDDLRGLGAHIERVE